MRLTAPLLSLIPIQAFGAGPSPEQVAAAYWDIVQDVCPVEAQNYPGEMQAEFLAGIADNVAEWDDEELAVEWPLSRENYQITSYVVVQAAQVIAMLIYETELRASLDDPAELAADSYDNATSSTALATCLIPTSERFTDAEEEGISMLAHLVTKDVLCTKWYEYSSRMLALDVSGLNEEEYVQAWLSIGMDTIESCEETS